MIIVESKKIFFRPIKKEDLNLICQWQNDPQIFINIMSNRFPVSELMVNEWYEKKSTEKRNRSVYFATIEKESNKIIGIAQLNNIDWISGTCSWGSYIGDKEKWGLGYGTQVVYLLMEYAFKFLGLRKIWGEALLTNAAALKYLKKIGCSQEGILKKHFYFDNIYHDVAIMSVFKDDYLKSKKRKSK